MDLFETLHHHPGHPQHQEQPMQQASLAGNLHSIAAAIDSNPLVARLLEQGLGKWLTQGEVDSLVALIAGTEQLRSMQHAQQVQSAPAEQPERPNFTPSPFPPADGAGQHQVLGQQAPAQ